MSPRAWSTLAGLVSVLAAGGCSNSSVDPCQGIAGACLTLTITSQRISSVDALTITASGAVTGMQTTMGPRPLNLPVRVAVKLTRTGAIHFAVTGLQSGSALGTGALDTTIAAGEHQSRTIDIEPAGGTDGGTDGPDAGPVTCDPRGVRTPACVWRWQTPLPQADDLIGVYAYADNDIVAFSGSNTSTHRDATGWTLQRSRPTPAMGIFTPRVFAGGPDLYVYGFNSAVNLPPEIFRSIDKGVSWTEETLPSIGPNVLPGAIGTRGGTTLAVSSQCDFFTRDPGTGNWSTTRIDFGATNSCSAHAVNVGILQTLVVGNIGGASPGVLIAHGVGTAFTDVLPRPSTTGILQGACSGGTSTFRYWAVGTSGMIFTSTDATNWTPQTSNTANDLTGCEAVDENNVWAWGRNGTIVHSTNGGTSWVAQTSLTPEYLAAGSHSPSSTMTVVGQVGVLLRATDGMSTYTNERAGLSALWFTMQGFPPHTVYVAGANGSLARTTDGLTWQMLASGSTTKSFFAIWGTSATNVYVVGSQGSVLHSTDGTTFTPYVNPATGGIPVTESLGLVTGLGPNNVFILGNASLYRSTDGGSSFAPVTVTGLTGVPTSVFAMAGDLWVGGAMGQVYHSTDGTTWTSQSIPAPGNADAIGRMRGRTPGDLFFGYQSAPSVSHSTNGGMTWTTISPGSGLLGTDTGLFEIAATPTGSYIYASGQNGFVVSLDEGANWNFVDTGITRTGTTGLWAFSDTDVFAVVQSGGIIHYGN